MTPGCPHLALAAAFAIAFLAPPARAAENFQMRLGLWELSTTVERLALPVVHRMCITKPDLSAVVHGPDTIEDDPCKPEQPPRSSARRWSQTLRCQDGSQMHAEFTTRRPERFSGSLVRIGGRQALAQRVQISGRWLGADCRSVR